MYFRGVRSGLSSIAIDEPEEGSAMRAKPDDLMGAPVGFDDAPADDGILFYYSSDGGSTVQVSDIAPRSGVPLTDVFAVDPFGDAVAAARLVA
jgi:hypothetical protein